MAVRNVWFELNFLTLQGKPKHTSCGYSQSHTCNFSPLFTFHGSRPPCSSTEFHEPRYSVGPWLLLHSPCAHGNDIKMVGGMSTHRFNQVLKDYRLPYSRHVVSMFKKLTTTTTYRNLSIFVKQMGPQSSTGIS
jgi:hypothetical protein